MYKKSMTIEEVKALISEGYEPLNDLARLLDPKNKVVHINETMNIFVRDDLKQVDVCDVYLRVPGKRVFIEVDDSISGLLDFNVLTPAYGTVLSHGCPWRDEYIRLVKELGYL